MYNIEKYKSLAGGNPRGILLRTMVDQEYVHWLEIVETAPWLRNWGRSSLYDCENAPRSHCCDPSGNLIKQGYRFQHYRIANAVYATTVWGFGMCNWTDTDAYGAMIRLQGLSAPNKLRQYMFDSRLRQTCGINMPLEVGELDKWLEPLWLRTYINSK